MTVSGLRMIAPFSRLEKTRHTSSSRPRQHPRVWVTAQSPGAGLSVRHPATGRPGLLDPVNRRGAP